VDCQFTVTSVLIILYFWSIILVCWLPRVKHILCEIDCLLFGAFMIQHFFSRTRRRSAYQYINKKVGENIQKTQALICLIGGGGKQKPIETNPPNT